MRVMGTQTLLGAQMPGYEVRVRVGKLTGSSN